MTTSSLTLYLLLVIACALPLHAQGRTFQAGQSSSFAIAQDSVFLFENSRPYFTENSITRRQGLVTVDVVTVGLATARIPFGFGLEKEFGYLTPDHEVNGVLGFGPSGPGHLDSYFSVVSGATRNHISPAEFTIAINSETGHGVLELGPPTPQLALSPYAWTSLSVDDLRPQHVIFVADVRVDETSISNMTTSGISFPAILDSGSPCITLPNVPWRGVGKGMFQEYQRLIYTATSGAPPPPTVLNVTLSNGMSLSLPLADICVHSGSTFSLGLSFYSQYTVVHDFSQRNNPRLGLARQNKTFIDHTTGTSTSPGHVRLPMKRRSARQDPFYTVSIQIGTPAQEVEMIVDTSVPALFLIGNFQRYTPAFYLIVVFFTLALVAGSVMLIVRQRRRMRRYHATTDAEGRRVRLFDEDWESTRALEPDPELGAGGRSGNGGRRVTRIMGIDAQGRPVYAQFALSRPQPPVRQPAPFHQVVLPPRNTRRVNSTPPQDAGERGPPPRSPADDDSETGMPEQEGTELATISPSGPSDDTTAAPTTTSTTVTARDGDVLPGGDPTDTTNDETPLIEGIQLFEAQK